MCAKKTASIVGAQDNSRPFDFRNYTGLPFGSSFEFRSGFQPPVCPPVSRDEDFIEGAIPLSVQIRKSRSGGLPPTSRDLSDANYDEVDSFDVDPSVDRSVDRLERTQLITQLISERMASSHESELNHADV